MPPERASDQAEGLRRLLLRDPARVVMVAAARAGLGATSVTVNLATALAQSGESVLVLDENLSHGNAANMLGLKPRHDLLSAVRRDMAWREIVLHSRQGVRILPAARAIRSLPQFSATERENLLACLAEASRGAGIVLVDTAPCAYPFSLAPGQPLLLVLNATAAAITESYALIKRLAARDGRQRFMVAVNKARDEREAQTVFGNMEQVARRHLRVRVEYLGFVPVDEMLQCATQLRRSVLEAFPAAPSAFAFEKLGRNLMLLPDAGNRQAAGLPDVAQRLAGRSRSPDVALAAY
ncbi:MAG: P-loop NTPase [Nitrosomonadales bacterium]|nr:P-loop NTPase [Nitrosomonadales bacterium]